jgi:hypothetical protein
VSRESRIFRSVLQGRLLLSPRRHRHRKETPFDAEESHGLYIIQTTLVIPLYGNLTWQTGVASRLEVSSPVAKYLWVGEQAGVMRARHTWVPEPGRRRRQQTEGGHKEVAEAPYHAVKFRPYS